MLFKDWLSWGHFYFASTGLAVLCWLISVASVAEEIVRTLIGSLGLVTAVPISTLIAALFALYNDRLGEIRPYLGPETGGDVHSH
jgi:hypothetical protein